MTKQLGRYFVAAWWVLTQCPGFHHDLGSSVTSLLAVSCAPAGLLSSCFSSLVLATALPPPPLPSPPPLPPGPPPRCRLQSLRRRSSPPRNASLSATHSPWSSPAGGGAIPQACTPLIPPGRQSSIDNGASQICPPSTRAPFSLPDPQYLALFLRLSAFGLRLSHITQSCERSHPSCDMDVPCPGCCDQQVTCGVSSLPFSFDTPPEATNTGPGFNRGSGGGVRGYGFEDRAGAYARTEGVISYSPRSLSGGRSPDLGLKFPPIRGRVAEVYKEIHRG